MAIYRWVAQEDLINKEKLFLVGRSLGGAVAIDLVARLPKPLFAGVVIESTFTSILDMADELFDFLRPVKTQLKRCVLRSYWNSISKVSAIKLPIMFISGTEDNFVPTWMTVKLHKECQSDVKLIHLIEGGDHNNTVQVAGETYFEFYRDFFRVALRKSGTKIL